MHDTSENAAELQLRIQRSLGGEARLRLALELARVAGVDVPAVDLATGWKIDLIMRKSREFSRIEFETSIEPTSSVGWSGSASRANRTRHAAERQPLPS
jgi:hypothetical protein